MKKICKTALMTLLLALSSTALVQAAPTKQQKRAAYAVKNLKLDDTKSKQLLPVLMEYLKELKAAQKPYEDLKEKYKADIKNGTLTDKAATALLTAKWTSDRNEVTVRQKYEKRFMEIIPAKKVWYCFDLLNDKMSKIDGTKGSTDEDEDD